MPVVINQRDQGSNKPAERQQVARVQPVTASGLRADVRIVVAIVATVVLLLVGLVGWSLGWFGGAAPANAPSPTAGKTIAPLGGSDEDNPMGHKRNKSLGE